MDSLVKKENKELEELTILKNDYYNTYLYKYISKDIEIYPCFLKLIIIIINY